MERGSLHLVQEQIVFTALDYGLLINNILHVYGKNRLEHNTLRDGFLL